MCNYLQHTPFSTIRHSKSVFTGTVAAKKSIRLLLAKRPVALHTAAQYAPVCTNSSLHTEAAYKQKAPAACAGRGSIEKNVFLLVFCIEMLHHFVEISLCALQAVMIASVP